MTPKRINYKKDKDKDKDKLLTKDSQRKINTITRETKRETNIKYK